MVQKTCINHNNTRKSKNTNQGMPELPFCISITCLPGNVMIYLPAPDHQILKLAS